MDLDLNTNILNDHVQTIEDIYSFQPAPHFYYLP